VNPRSGCPEPQRCSDLCRDSEDGRIGIGTIRLDECGPNEPCGSEERHCLKCRPTPMPPCLLHAVAPILLRILLREGERQASVVGEDAAVG
jgi:hypothetical protein